VTEQPESEKHLTLRASDADRERVAKVLHEAMSEGRLTIAELDERLTVVYAAKTLGDLLPPTADLPGTSGVAVPTPQSPQPYQPGGALSSRITTEEPDRTPLFAMLGGFDRKGAWVMPPTLNAFGFMAGGDIDLTQAKFSQQECTIQCFALMAGINIVVPEDVTVKMHGIGIMGAFEQRRGDAVGTDPNGPVLHITGVALMGGVDVRRPKPRKRLRRGED
jgi:Domain of unknown function (DUF1707)/Cell wall-active antibiotics response 4TMS YvqF